MAKATTATRKGDMIEFGDGAHRLERVVLTADGVRREAGDDGDLSTYKLYARSETPEGTDDDGNPCRLTPDGDPTTYTYRYDPIAEFTAADDDAAETEAKRLIAGS